jgi:hypothetical protein
MAERARSCHGGRRSRDADPAAEDHRPPGLCATPGGGGPPPSRGRGDRCLAVSSMSDTRERAPWALCGGPALLAALAWAFFPPAPSFSCLWMGREALSALNRTERAGLRGDTLGRVCATHWAGNACAPAAGHQFRKNSKYMINLRRVKVFKSVQSEGKAEGGMPWQAECHSWVKYDISICPKSVSKCPIVSHARQ